MLHEVIMHLSQSHADFDDLNEAQYSSLLSREKEAMQAGPNVRPMQHLKRVKFPPRESCTDGEPLVEFFGFSGWKNGGWSWLLVRIFPCIGWLRSYKWNEYLKSDVIAGITVGTMLVPQAMSYSKLAGLSPIYGLYSGFMPVLAYAIFGSSRQLGVGPVAMISMLVLNGLLSIVDPAKAETEEARQQAQILYTQLAFQLALLVGVIECLMGLVRLGWLIRFISHSVVSGFTTASAVIIGLSQASSFVGYDTTPSSQLITIISSLIEGSDGFMWQPFLMGSATLAVLLIMKHLGKTYKHFRYLRAAGPLTAIILGITFIKVFRPESIKLVGEVPQGFPSFSLHFNFNYTKRLLTTAVLVSGVGILESVGIAQALAAKNGYEIDSNQELFGLGISNIFGAAFSASPVAGSFSRSAVMNDSGAKTGLSGLVVFILISATLQFLTPIFTDAPQCGLAAIVISAVIGLLDYDEAIFLWRVAKKDLLLWVAACLFTLFHGIEIGVLTGVALSLIFVIYESANPHIAILGRLPETTVYRNVKQYPDAYTYHGIVIIRVDAPIYFANISLLKDKLRCGEQYMRSGGRRGVEVDRISYVIFDMSPVTYIDSSAVHAIIELNNNYRARGIQLAVCNPNGKVMQTFVRAGFANHIGREWYFVRVHDAVQTCISRIGTHANNNSRLQQNDIEPVSVYIDNAPDDPLYFAIQSPEFDAASESMPLLSDNALESSSSTHC